MFSTMEAATRSSVDMTLSLQSLTDAPRYFNALTRTPVSGVGITQTAILELRRGCFGAYSLTSEAIAGMSARAISINFIPSLANPGLRIQLSVVGIGILYPNVFCVGLLCHN